MSAAFVLLIGLKHYPRPYNTYQGDAGYCPPLRSFALL